MTDRFTTENGVQGFTVIRRAPAEPTPHEKPDTQGTITEHSEENS
jgi:hypothetical protein